MSTKKFIATGSSFTSDGRRILVDEMGNRFRPAWMRQQPIEIGDKVYLGKRLNNHRGELPMWELWEYIVEPSDYSKPRFRLPRTWFRDGRTLFDKI